MESTLDWLRSTAIPSIFGGVAGAMTQIVVRWIQVRLRLGIWPWPAVDWRRAASAAGLVALFILVLLSFAPPYRVSLDRWCVNGNGTEVSGFARRRLTGAPADQVTVRARLFRGFERINLLSEAFDMTQVNGSFTVNLGSALPEAGSLYSLSLGYLYAPPLREGRWSDATFTWVNPASCHGEESPGTVPAPAPPQRPVRTECLDAVDGAVPAGAVLASPDGSRRASEVAPYGRARFRVVDARTGRDIRLIQVMRDPQRRIPEVDNQLKGLCWSPDGRFLGAMYHHKVGGYIAILDADSGVERSRVNVPTWNQAFRFSRDGRSVETGTDRFDLVSSNAREDGPVIRMTEIPPYDDAGGDVTSAKIAGTVIGPTRGLRVVIYACTNSCYVQPRVDAPYSEIDARGSWSNTIHTGREYVALLVDSRFRPEPVMAGPGSYSEGVVARVVVRGQEPAIGRR